MPENPNIDPDTGSDGYYTNVSMATTNNNNNNNRKQGAPRVSSAALRHYDISTQLLGKTGPDLEELFIAAARDGVHEKIENFLHRNRTDYVISIDVKDKKTGNTPLIWAAKRGHAKIVQLLLRHGADITLRNYEGQTAVEVASPSIRSILLESVERTTEASHQLLLQAAWQGDIKVVSRLLTQKKVLDINCLNGDGFTPIMLATRDMHLFEKLASQMSRDYNPIEVVTALLAARADLHATDGDGKTCLHHASQSKAQIAQAVVASIITGGPDLEQKDKRCFAPLHCASLTGNADSITTLLDGGSEINSRGFAGATALHITSYNNHERATTVLLERGANVTLTDDRGLTPLDFAKTRKMRKKLQEAWGEATLSRANTTLGPIRAHSKEDLRSSVEDLSKRRKGEVIFEGLPSNPFSDSNKRDSIANPKGITRHLSLKDKAKEGETQPHLRDNVRKLGQVRNQQKPSPLPRTKSRSTERLPMISPDRVSSDRNLESPVMFGRNSRARRSFEDRKQGRSRRVNPLTSREGSTLVDDVFDRLTPGPPSPTPSLHRRSDSDPRGTPNLMDIAASCEPYLHGQKRGRSYSVNSNPAHDLDANCLREFTPLQREPTINSIQREITLMSVCSNRSDSRMSTHSNSPKLLNLGQMLSKSKTPVQPLYGPGSNKVIPPTPTFLTQKYDGKSENEFSPRSEEEMDVPELRRSKSIFKEEFVLEESRPREIMQTSSSGTDTLSSSGSSHLSASPRDSPLVMKGKQHRKKEAKTVNQPNQNQSEQNQSVQNQSLQVTGNSTSNNGSVKKVQLKTNTQVAAASSQSSKVSVQNDVPKEKGANPVVLGSRNASVLHNMAVRNAAIQNAAKVNGLSSDGANRAGVIVVHGNISDIVENQPESSANDAKDSNGNLVKSSPKDSDAKPENVEVNNGIDAKKSDTKQDTKAQKDGNKTANNRKRTAQKQMQNVLQVVPTKLTENIVRTAPKGKKETKSGVKVVSSTNQQVSVVSSTNQVSNVNMQLSPSATVQSRVQTQSSNERTQTQNPVKVSNSENIMQGTNVKTGGNNESKSDQVTEKTNVLPNTSENQLTSETVSRQGSQSRNSKFSNSKSAVTSQRQMGNVRKTSSSYTPRFQSSITSNTNAMNSVSNKTELTKISDSKELREKSSASDQSKTSDESKKSDIQTKSPTSTSPTDIVTATVCRSSSISKSYNMSGVPTLTKSSSSGSVTSDTQTTTTISSTCDKPVNKHSILSKSVSEPLQGSSNKVSNAGIVTQSLSKMPNVGTVPKDKIENKSLLRSSSMSTIEETKEKQLMSSSDTKIEYVTKSSKQRPLSDGQMSASASKDKTPTVKAPLINIIPSNEPRISRLNYVDVQNPVSTPLIVNPFEELEQKRALTATEFGFTVDKPGVERSKTQVSLKTRSQKSGKKSSNKPSSASTRGSSGRKKRSRSKDGQKSDNESSRPKSGKSGRRVRSGKRKRKIPENLAKENDKPDVALIGGIGWQIKTSCIDKSDADAVIVSQIDSSAESEVEDTDVKSHMSPLHLVIPENNLQLPLSLGTPSSAHTPRFREIRFEEKAEEDKLQYIEDDGYRPMNLDMTQNSLGHQNRAGVIIEQDMPGDISDFLSKLREDESEMFDDDDDDEFNEDDYLYDDEGNIDNMLYRQMAVGQLTPIPESPSLTRTSSTLKCVAKTVDAISKFDQVVKDEDLNRLLGSTPRRKSSGSHNNSSSDISSVNSNRTSPLRNSGGTVRTAACLKESKQSITSSNASKSPSSRNSSSKTRTSSLSAEIKERANKVFANTQFSPKSASGSLKESNQNDNSLRKSGSLRKSISKEKLNSIEEHSQAAEVEANQSESNNETKERINTKIMDLKKLLTEKMQSTQKLLEESSPYNSYKRRKQSEGNQQNLEGSPRENFKLNIKDLTEENLRALETSRTDDDSKSTRSSRKERRFSETKKEEYRDDEINEAIDEILSNTVSSTKSNVRSVQSFRSASSTLTEKDKNVLKQMVQQNQASPFHAKETVRVSSSYDESVTLNKDNPELMKRFQADNFHIGQKVKAMIEAGADSHKVKAMVKADNEAKQLARIMNSFRQMELYAGPQSKKETPRKEGENMHKSLIRFDNGHHSQQNGMPPRPGSAGAGRFKTGKFTEIKGGKSASHAAERTHSPVHVPTELADEFKRSPFKQVITLQEDNIDDLAHVIKVTSQSSEEDHFSLDDDTMERADSACTTLSSHSSFMEETIQWKKGNVLGKGAFGTVWCGLTSEGQLIAVKQIELNTTNQHKAKKEYEKVQEEVELLKTLEHKNIVGYLGTSLEDSIVSIFMQFVPGGSIASILARFGALDEAVFKKYTRQILEGVQYLHDNDVIHRDIKGGNVMLMPNGVIKLIDFGCAKRLCINLSMGQSQILKSMKGTPYWMAPEVVNETGHGKKSDIWSVGCTVFEMATRKPPWAEMNPMAAIFAIGSDKPVPQLPEKFSQEARDFVNCCLTKDQSKRLSARELLNGPFLKRRSRKNATIC